MKFYMGVDPGINGCVCIRDEGSTFLEFVGLPDIKEFHTGGKTYRKSFAHNLYQALRKHASLVELNTTVEFSVVIEKVGGIRGQGAAPAFNFGAGYGLTIGLLMDILDSCAPDDNRLTVRHIASSKWKGFVGALAIFGENTKSKSLKRAYELMNAHGLGLDRVTHDEADAFLMTLVAEKLDKAQTLDVSEEEVI